MGMVTYRERASLLKLDFSGGMKRLAICSWNVNVQYMCWQSKLIKIWCYILTHHTLCSYNLDSKITCKNKVLHANPPQTVP
jgi:hypothetical protein